MKPFPLIPILFVAVIAGLVLFNFLPHGAVVSNRVCYKLNCFEVEVASTEAQRVAGLSNRTSLEAEKGMLFVFSQAGNYPFWMKGMNFPLDIIWIAKNGTVVFIERNAQPCTTTECIPIDPQKNVSYVLEVNAGIASSIGLKVGDKVEIKLFELVS